MDPQRLRNLERTWQDEIGARLLDKPFELPGSAIVYERQFDRIAEALGGVGNGPLIDVGCGRGQFLEHLRKGPIGAGRLLIGVDVSVAAEAVSERGAVGVRADGEHLPFVDECAQAVVYNGSLHHVVDYRAAVREALRVLRPGGSFVVFEPVSSAFSRAAHRLLDPIVFRTNLEYESPVDQELKHEFREERVLEELRADAVVVRRATSDFLAYPFTGCYAGAFFTKSLGFMRTLIALERFAERAPVLRRLARAVAWRFLIVAKKRGSASSAKPDYERIEQILACPRCKRLFPDAASPTCVVCGHAYRVERGVPVLLRDEARPAVGK